MAIIARKRKKLYCEGIADSEKDILFVVITSPEKSYYCDLLLVSIKQLLYYEN